ncbi:MAG: efflux RND transporter permease subunit, partial [Limisphaerales bacterium]
EKLKRILVPVKISGDVATAANSGEAMEGGTDSKSTVVQVPLGQLAEIKISQGPPSIKDEDGALTGWVYVDIADRDIGSYVEEAKAAVNEKIEKEGLLPAGYRLEWTGQYEYMLRVKERLKVVVPITILIIFVLLYMNFKNVAQTFIILLSVPFAMTGSIWILYLMGYHLSIAVWVGIIALAGLAAQTGTVMIIYLDEAYNLWKEAGKMKTQYDLFEAITYGAVQRVRPKLMTVSMIIIGLVPALWAEGAGAEAIQRIAAPMVGGLITSTVLTLEIVPAIYSIWRGRSVQWVKGPRPPKKTWSQLSEEFVKLESVKFSNRNPAQ